MHLVSSQQVDNTEEIGEEDESSDFPEKNYIWKHLIKAYDSWKWYSF